MLGCFDANIEKISTHPSSCLFLFSTPLKLVPKGIYKYRSNFIVSLCHIIVQNFLFLYCLSIRKMQIFLLDMHTWTDVLDDSHSIHPQINYLRLWLDNRDLSYKSAYQIDILKSRNKLWIFWLSRCSKLPSNEYLIL